jgi:amino acid permease
MVAKYLYAYITLGILFFGMGIYKLIEDHGFSATVFGDFIPAFLIFYLAYKAYKNKKDQELM